MDHPAASTSYQRFPRLRIRELKDDYAKFELRDTDASMANALHRCHGHALPLLRRLRWGRLVRALLRRVPPRGPRDRLRPGARGHFQRPQVHQPQGRTTLLYTYVDEKLYFWERKLYAEVKAEEKMCLLLAKNSKRLKFLDQSCAEDQD